MLFQASPRVPKVNLVGRKPRPRLADRDYQTLAQPGPVCYGGRRAILGRLSGPWLQADRLRQSNLGPDMGADSDLAF